MIDGKRESLISKELVESRTIFEIKLTKMKVTFVPRLIGVDKIHNCFSTTIMDLRI